jgi:hypothetical protein
VAESVTLYDAFCVAPGSELVVIASGELMVMLSAFVALFTGELESVTWTMKLLLPFVVGVPVIVPALAFSDKPACRLPVLIDQIYGVVPPVAARVAL